MRADRAALIEFTEQWANDCPDEPRFRQIVAALQLTPLDQEEQIAHDAELFEAGRQHGIKHYPFGAAPVAALGAAPWQPHVSCCCPAKRGEDCPLTAEECDARQAAAKTLFAAALPAAPEQP